MYSVHTARSIRTQKTHEWLRFNCKCEWENAGNSQSTKKERKICSPMTYSARGFKWICWPISVFLFRLAKVILWTSDDLAFSDSGDYPPIRLCFWLGIFQLKCQPHTRKSSSPPPWKNYVTVNNTYMLYARIHCCRMHFTGNFVFRC